MGRRRNRWSGEYMRWLAFSSVPLSLLPSPVGCGEDHCSPSFAKAPESGAELPQGLCLSAVGTKRGHRLAVTFERVST